MRTIDYDDVMYATLSQHGRMVASLRLIGVTSWADVVRKVCSAVRSCCAGMATIMLRNSSQGWAQQRSIVLRGTAQEEAVQLSLF